jgi:DNA-binding CsgD family transcriptional regulator
VLVLDHELGRDMVTDRGKDLTDDGHVVVVFSVHVKPLIVQAVLEAGAFAFLDKRTERGQFVDTVVCAGRGEPIVTPSMAGAMVGSTSGPTARAPALAEREREALLHLFQGMSYASIARRMHKIGSPDEPISPITVKQYVNRARAKFAAVGRPCPSNLALLARCIEDGLLRPEDIGDYRSARPATGSAPRGPTSTRGRARGRGTR